MTKEKRIIFELNDLVAIRIKCVKCKGETILDLGKRTTQYLPSGCSVCNSTWYNPRDDSPEATLVELISGHRIEDEKSIRLRFELPDDDEPDR